MIPGTLIMLATMLTLLVVIREHQHIDLAGTGWALAGRVPGTIAGALLLMALPEKALALMLAGVVLAGVVLTSVGWVPVPHRRNLVLAGATSGVLGTATSIGGPPMALVWQNTSGARLRGTMSGFFLVGSVLSIAVLGDDERNGQVLVGFGAELGEAGLERKRRMLTDKNIDLVVYNDVSAPGIGFDTTDNEVTLVTRAGERELPRASKDEIAAGIVDEVERLLEERRGG